MQTFYKCFAKFVFKFVQLFRQTDWPYQLANNGYKVVMTPATHLYLDHPEEPDPEERGLYWATRFIDMKTIFGFQPFRLYQTSARAVNWSPVGPGAHIPPNYKCIKHGTEYCIQLEKPENIVGMQCSTWSETLQTDEQMMEHIFPRVFACAERAANPRPPFESDRTRLFDREWNDFVLKTPRYIKMLEDRAIPYHIPVPGVKDGKTNTQVCIHF